jgi:hypothetical protein
VPHRGRGVIHGSSLHGLAPLALALAERIRLAIHVHVRRHPGASGQCDDEERKASGFARDCNKRKRKKEKKKKSMVRAQAPNTIRYLLTKQR